MFHNPDDIRGFLTDGIAHCRVLVLGDVMLDRYYYGDVQRISPEAPVPVALINDEKTTLGGAANVALNLFQLGCQTKLVGVTGQDENAARLRQKMQEVGMDTAGLLVEPARPTTTKLRIIGGHQQMLRLDFENAAAIAGKTERKIKDRLDELLTSGLDCLIISDYAKGVCTKSLCQYLIQKADEQGFCLIVDPKGTDWRKYAGASCITPNMKELGEALHDKMPNTDAAVEKAGTKLRRKYRLKSLVVTRSEQGMTVIDERQALHIPTLAQEVFDVSGAGDTVIAALGAAAAWGMDMQDAARLANLAAKVVVGKVGTYPIHRQELLQACLIEKSEKTLSGGT